MHRHPFLQMSLPNHPPIHHDENSSVLACISSLQTISSACSQLFAGLLLHLESTIHSSHLSRTFSPLATVQTRPRQQTPIFSAPDSSVPGACNPPSNYLPTYLPDILIPRSPSGRAIPFPPSPFPFRNSSYPKPDCGALRCSQ